MASALLLVALVAVGYRVYVHAKRVVLWRVRRKLMLSYLFVGFVPALLLVLFFSIAGLLLFVNVGGFLLRSRLTTLVERAQALAQTAAADLAHVRGADAMAAALAAHQQRANAQLPLVSYAVVPSSAACTPGTATRSARAHCHRGPVAAHAGAGGRRRNGCRAPATGASWPAGRRIPRTPGWPRGRSPG